MAVEGKKRLTVVKTAVLSDGLSPSHHASPTSAPNLVRRAGSENPMHSNMSDKKATTRTPLTHQPKYGKKIKMAGKLTDGEVTEKCCLWST